MKPCWICQLKYTGTISRTDHFEINYISRNLNRTLFFKFPIQFSFSISGKMMINGDRSQEMEYERAITRTQRGLGQGSGQSLAPFLGKLINFGDETQADFLSHPVAKKFLEPHSDDVKADENIAELVCFCSLPDFEAFVKDVQLSKDCLSVLASQPGQILMKSEGLSFVLLQASVDNKKLLNQIVKLPDILCNAFEGKLPEDLKVEDLIEHVLYNILLCHRLYLSAGSSNIQPLLNVLAYR